MVTYANAVKAATILFVLVFAAQASAWAAVAVNPMGPNVGYGFGASPNRNAARQNALRYCGPRCRLARETRTGCVALADNAIGYDTGIGRNKRAAERAALRSCQSFTGHPCSVRSYACSSGGNR